MKSCVKSENAGHNSWVGQRTQFRWW